MANLSTSGLEELVGGFEDQQSDCCRRCHQKNDKNTDHDLLTGDLLLIGLKLRIDLSNLVNRAEQIIDLVLFLSYHI